MDRLLGNHELWALGTRGDNAQPSPVLDHMSATLVGIPPASPMASLRSYVRRAAVRIDPTSARMSTVVGARGE